MKQLLNETMLEIPAWILVPPLVLLIMTLVYLVDSRRSIINNIVLMLCSVLIKLFLIVQVIYLLINRSFVEICLKEVTVAVLYAIWICYSLWSITKVFKLVVDNEVRDFYIKIILVQVVFFITSWILPIISLVMINITFSIYIVIAVQCKKLNKKI